MSSNEKSPDLPNYPIDVFAYICIIILMGTKTGIDEVGMDNHFAAHNLQVKQVWERYYSGVPERIPMQISANPRMILLDGNLNPDRISFYD